MASTDAAAGAEVDDDVANAPLHAWAVAELRRMHFEGEPEALATYVVALVENHADELHADAAAGRAALRARATEDLEDFLGQPKAGMFVDALLTASRLAAARHKRRLSRLWRRLSRRRRWCPRPWRPRHQHRRQPGGEPPPPRWILPWPNHTCHRRWCR